MPACFTVFTGAGAGFFMLPEKGRFRSFTVYGGINVYDLASAFAIAAVHTSSE
jgi:hypothetical protein